MLRNGDCGIFRYSSKEISDYFQLIRKKLKPAYRTMICESTNQLNELTTTDWRSKEAEQEQLLPTGLNNEALAFTKRAKKLKMVAQILASGRPRTPVLPVHSSSVLMKNFRFRECYYWDPLGNGDLNSSISSSFDCKRFSAPLLVGEDTPIIQDVNEKK